MTKVEHQQLRHGLQHQIALGLAVALIDPAEVVQVDRQQRQRALLLVGLAQGLIELPPQVFGGAQRGEVVEQPMFAKQPLALVHLRVDGALFLVQVVDAEGQQQQTYRHGRGFQPVVPGDAGGDLDEFVEQVHPPGKADAGQAQCEQPRHPAGRAAVQQHDQPGEGEGGATAFADDVHPVDLAPGFDRADCEQQLQADVGGQGEAEEGEGVEFEEGFHRVSVARVRASA